MGWGLAGTGNSSVATFAVTGTSIVIAPHTPNIVCFGGNGFLRDKVKNERSRRDTTTILIVWTLRILTTNMLINQEKNSCYIYRLVENTCARNNMLETP